MARRKAKKRFPVLRFMMKFVVAVLVLIGIALVGLFLMPAEKIAGIAADRFEAMTGREMVLEGDVRPSLFPQLGVKTGRVSIANADWSDGGAMLQAEGLTVGVDLRALMGGDVRITEVLAIAPKILLEIAPDGRGNWEFGEARAKSKATGGGNSGDGAATKAPVQEVAGGRTISLDLAEITDGQVKFVDHRSGASYEMSAVDATISLPDFAGVAAIKASGQINKQMVAVDARIAEFEAFISDGAVPVTLTANIGGAELGFDGRGGLTPLAATGVFEAGLGDMVGLFAVLGTARPDLPAGLGQSNISLSGDLTYAENRVSLRGGTIVLDQNRLVGSVDLGFGRKPSVTAKLQAGTLDLSALAGGKTAKTVGDTGKSGNVIQKSEKPAKAQAGTSWSKTPIDVSGLGLVDADILIEADKVALGTTELGRTTILARLNDRRAEVDIQELQAFEGAVSGKLVANGRGGLSVSADLAGRAIALKPLLSQLAGYDRLIGAGQMTIDVLGTGNSIDAIMNSLNGKGTFKIGAGELLGLDLVGMLRNLDAGYVGPGAKTIFDEVSGTFRIKDGVLINDDLSLISSLLTTTGAGKVGLGGQTLNYRLVPTLLAGQGKGLTVPLLITGSWANPKFRLDIEALAGDKIDKAKAEAQQEVMDAIQKKVQDELGIDLGLGDGGTGKTDKKKKNNKNNKKKNNKKADPQQQLKDAATEQLLKFLNPN